MTPTGRATKLLGQHTSHTKHYEANCTGDNSLLAIINTEVEGK